MKHENNGFCPMCHAILDRYPVYQPLKDWFMKFQNKNPEAHVSCAGRGEMDQEACFIRKASKARWGESSHNYGAGLDLFENSGNPKDIYEKNWFQVVLAPQLPEWMTWYGAPRSKFYELPHVEVTDWRQLVKDGKLKLVE